MTGELERFTRRSRRRALWQDHPSNTRVHHTRKQIERILRQRDPMLLIDSIEELNLEIPQATGRRTIRKDDPFLAGHFPGQPIYPGALQIETIGQMSLCLLHFMLSGQVDVSAHDRPLDTRALKVHHAVFVGAVVPGMELEIQAQGLGSDSLTATFGGQLLQDGSVLSVAVMEVYVAGE